MKRLVTAALLICIAAAAWGCGGESRATAGEAVTAQHGSGSGGTDGGDPSASQVEDVVARENPGLSPRPFDGARNGALAGAQPLDVVTWTAGPAVSFGALEAQGALGDGARLFDPTVDGEGAGFIVYFRGNPEPLVLLLPDLGDLHIWDTDETVAPTEFEVEGGKFTLRAYSPLFMDVGPDDLEVRVFGYGPGGGDALLGVAPVTVP